MYLFVIEAHQELLDTSVDAIMGDYNSVYAAVTKQLKINYYVMSLTPEDQADTKFMYQFFHDARVFSRAVLDLAYYYAFDKITVIHDSYEGRASICIFIKKSCCTLSPLNICFFICKHD